MRVAVAAATLIIVAPASAHVVVLPSVAPKGTPTEFTLQVPTERNLPTTAVRVMFPPQVSVYSFQVPPPGFTVTPILAKNQSIIGAVFRGTIPVGEYQAFHFLGTPVLHGPDALARLPDVRRRTRQAVERARRGARSGLGRDRRRPSPGPPAPSRSSRPGPATATATTGGRSSGSGSDAGVWLGLVAIVIAIGAAVAAGLLWATRPVRLPDDDQDASST